jgi:hypothetical protein
MEFDLQSAVILSCHIAPSLDVQAAWTSKPRTTQGARSLLPLSFRVERSEVEWNRGISTQGVEILRSPHSPRMKIADAPC